MNPNSIICLGDNCIDRYEVPIRRRFVGGNGVNTAVFAAATGCRTAYAGAVGDDDGGRAVRRKLQEKGIDVSMIQVYPSETAWTDVTFEENERVFGEEFYDTVRMFRITDDVLAYLNQFGIIHNTFLGGTESQLERIRRHCPGQISMDFGERYNEEFLELCLPFVDIAFFSTDSGDVEEAKRFVKSMHRRGPSLVIETMGKYGAVCSADGTGCLSTASLSESPSPGTPIFESARNIEIVDTLGAGDTFIGTFLGEYAQGQSPAVCMKKATDAAAASCMRFGGFDGCEI